MKLQPVNVVPFWLNDIEPFINRDHPLLFPEDSRYRMYWTEQAQRCVEGHWGYDFAKGVGGWRYMPGNLYFYMNFFPILHEGEQGTEIEDFPLLRDIDWLQFYAYLECDGFSGFEFDDNYTCFRPIDKMERNVELLNKEKVLFKKYESFLRRKDGRLKKYIDPQTYLYQTFDEPKGKPLFMNEALNLILLSSRGVGKSFGTCGGVITYDFTFNGARTIHDFMEKKTSTTVVVGAGESGKSKELLEKFITGYDFLRTNFGAYEEGEYQKNGVFWRPYEGSLTLGKLITNRVRKEGGQGYIGPGSKIVHVSYQNKPSAGVGYRARRMVIEEAGLLDQFEKVHAENSATQQRETKTGYSIYIGTGGDIKKIRGIKDGFYNPEGYGCVGFPDVCNGTQKRIGLFFPAYYRSKLHKTEHGNTLIREAFDDEMRERELKKQKGSRSYEGHILSYPLVPQEMFMQSAAGTFPIELIEERLNELETFEEGRKSVGSLHYVNLRNTECEWQEDIKKELKPILVYGDEDSMHSKEGAIIIYEHPVPYKPKPTFQNPLYIVVYDPVANDGDGPSLCSVVVVKMWDFDDPTKIQYNIVAEWNGRNERTEDNHEMAFKLATYYGAKILPEYNVRDFVRYARMTNRYHMLEPRPGLALDGAIKQKVDYDVGVKVSPTMIPLFESFLNEMLTTVVDQEETIRGNEYNVNEIRMVSQCRSRRFLTELLFYNRDDNFDMISAMFLAAVWVRQQRLKPQKYESIQDDIDEQAEFRKSFQAQFIERKPLSAFNY